MRIRSSNGLIDEKDQQALLLAVTTKFERVAGDETAGLYRDPRSKRFWELIRVGKAMLFRRVKLTDPAEWPR